MDSPPYMNHVLAVAKHHSSSLTEVGAQLRTTWESFENTAKQSAYDVLGWDTDLWNLMDRLLDLLYRIPGAVAEIDVEQLKVKNKEYGGSWHRRGGQGAFMMLARKWDRVDEQIKNAPRCGDLASAVEADRRQEGILDDLGDLRRYLVLVRAWHRAAQEPQQAEIAF